jgi:hypothetical protein
MEPYRYAPLTIISCSTRLVRLLPGNDKAEIRCDIFEFELPHSQRSSQFEALSYVWGDAHDRKRIFIGERYLDITVNLHTALRYLRDPALDRIMWIDAICINQEDLAERSRQVSFMMNTYVAAARVVVWLGEDTSGDQSCFPLFSRIARDHRQNESMERLSVPLRRNASFENLIQSPWFRRVWVSSATLTLAKHH